MPQGVLPNELRPPNLYYDHGNAREIFHPLLGLQTANRYISIQNRPNDPQNFNNGRQALSTDPGPSNSLDVKFMDGVTESHHDEPILFQMGVGEEQGQWPPYINAITYELRSLDDEVTHEAPALVVTTRAMRGNVQNVHRWTNLMILERRRWRSRSAMIYGPILAHSKRILFLNNWWSYHRWLVKLLRRECL